LRGLPNAPVRDVRISRCTFEGAAKANAAQNVEGLTIADVTVNGKTVAG